ncbi:MAG: hypothetical protein L6V85_08230 [Clostridiales bacterium]|nr:MAG: hypothetical protein L6V85_08230 [Clostridiales bacterium]
MERTINSQICITAKSVFGNEERDEYGLMVRLALFCGNDEEQLLRLFKSSGQFRDEKAERLLYANGAKRVVFHIGNKAVVFHKRTVQADLQKGKSRHQFKEIIKKPKRSKN